MKLAHGVMWLAVLLAGVSVASADDPIGTLSFGGSGGFSGATLSDINDRIRGDGNDFLEQKGWETLDAIGHGWTFWADVKAPIPFLEGFFLSGGYGISSAEGASPDTDQKITVKAEQHAFHVRLLYALPFRFHDNVRLFAGTGPLILREQKLTTNHTVRKGAGMNATERTEEITYIGDGLGWQFGIAAEYMVQDRVTLAFDLAYRWADVQYGSWEWGKDLTIATNYPESTYPDGTTDLERLTRAENPLDDGGYIFHGFIDWEATTDWETSGGQQEPHEFGPHVTQLRPLSKDDLEIQMSGLQVHLGFRFYFL